MMTEQVVATQQRTWLRDRAALAFYGVGRIEARRDARSGHRESPVALPRRSRATIRTPTAAAASAPNR